MSETEDFVEVIADELDRVDIKDTPHGDTWGAFLDLYKGLRQFYGEEAGLTEFDHLPSISDMSKIYDKIELSDDAIIKRRWLVASELALLDIAIRDRVAIKKYLESSTDQQYLTRAIDHFTKVVVDQDKWDIGSWKFVIAHKCDVDDYGLGKTATFEDEVFHYRFCADYEFADLFLQKFKKADLASVMLAPLTKTAFSMST